MTYNCRLHPLVEQDYDEAYDWYEGQKKGLGERFIKETRHTIDQITLQPETFGRRSNRKFREAKVDFFPFVVVYKIDKRSRLIFVVSIHHTSKNPRKKYRR